MSFLRPTPKLSDYNLNADYNSRRTKVKVFADNKTQYVMNIKLGPSMTKITHKTKRMNWLLGIFGGVLIFWYFVGHVLAKLYSRFKFYIYLSKVIYN